MAAGAGGGAAREDPGVWFLLNGRQSRGRNTFGGEGNYFCTSCIREISEKFTWRLTASISEVLSDCSPGLPLGRINGGFLLLPGGSSTRQDCTNRLCVLREEGLRPSRCAVTVGDLYASSPAMW